MQHAKQITAQDLRANLSGEAPVCEVHFSSWEEEVVSPSLALAHSQVPPRNAAAKLALEAMWPTEPYITHIRARLAPSHRKDESAAKIPWLKTGP